MLGRPITAFRPGGDTGRLTIKNARLKLTVRGEDSIKVTSPSNE